jgi:hypothetical protein
MAQDIQKTSDALEAALTAAHEAYYDNPKGTEVFDAVADAYHASGAESRMTGTFVDFAFAILRATLEAGVDDQSEQSEFYEGESRFDHSDHQSEDCIQWSKNHAKAAAVHDDTLTALAKLQAQFNSRLNKCDL